MVGWSYELLSQPECTLFNRLGVFVGGFTLEAAEAVGSDQVVEDPGTERLSSPISSPLQIPRLDVLDLLLRLVEKSLVLAEPGDDRANRYRLLETLRHYALEKLEASGEADVVHRRHEAYFFHLAEVAGREFWGPRLGTWHGWMQREVNNVRAALRWAIDRGEIDPSLQLCGALGEVFYYQGHPSEMRRWVDELLARSNANSPTVGRGRALVSLGILAWSQLDLDRADAILDEALAVLRHCNDQEWIATALVDKVYVAVDRGSYDTARALAEEALAIERALPALPNITTFHILGKVLFYLEDYPRAREAFEREITRRGSVEDTVQAANFDWLGHIATATGEYGEARRLCAESMRRRLRIDRKLGIAYTLSALAGLAAAQGQLARAARISGAAARLCELSGVPPHRTQEGYIRGKLLEIRATLGAATYDAAWADGQAMALEQAVAYALSDERQPRV
jgi:non-specific serine/threonine protein kinase